MALEGLLIVLDGIEKHCRRRISDIVPQPPIYSSSKKCAILIGRSCWTQVEVAGLKVETADFYVEVSLFCISIYIIYVLLEVEDH